jgi:hypothetical protein
MPIGAIDINQPGQGCDETTARMGRNRTGNPMQQPYTHKLALRASQHYTSNIRQNPAKETDEARTLRTIAQSDGFRHAVLADVSRSQVR